MKHLIFLLAFWAPAALSQGSASACYLTASFTQCYKPVNVASGGTGVTTLASNGVLIGAGTSPVVTATGTASSVLRIPDAGGTPAFGTINIASGAAITGILATTHGGTGLATFGTGGVLEGVGTGNVTTASGSANQVLVIPAAGGAPAFGPVILASSAAVTAKSPTQQVFTASGAGTYTTPSGVIYLYVRMVGGGGGGGGAGQGGGTAGAGTATTFGTTLLSAGGGAAGAPEVPGAGGSSSLGSGPTGLALTGGGGAPGGNNDVIATTYLLGGQGGNGAFGGGGSGGQRSSGSGQSGTANTGGGGGGGGSNAAAAGIQSGAGGGSGGYVDAIIRSPSATYSYVVGSGGSAGAGSTNGGAGGQGGIGVILVEEHYY